MPLKIAASLTVGGLILAATPAASAAYVKNAPAWAEAPSVADVAAAYPARAKAARVGGKVVLTCAIGHDDRPRDCAVLTEKPGGYAFGAAARQLAERMKVDEDGMNGKDIFIPFTFDPAVLSGPSTLTKPAWVSLPAAEDFQATFPKTENGVNNVRVVLGCTVIEGGALGGCAVNQEDPPGQGYGAGALALASKFRLSPWGADGEPAVGAHINLPIRYALTPAPAKK